jgi:hypothetical protein
MKFLDNPQTRTIATLVILIPILVVTSFLFGRIFAPHISDFAAYWQAGHMLIEGKDIYNSYVWIEERYALGTAFHSEPTFQYPLPFAVLMMPFGFLPALEGYILWTFLSQLSILVSLMLLLALYKGRPFGLDLIAVAGIFLLRATFVVLMNGQMLPELLLVIAAAVYLFKKGKWFSGGLILSFISLKPSVGFPILILTSLWLLYKRHWTAIAGLVSGAIILFFVGALYNPHWVIDYLSIGKQSFSKYYNFGAQPTIWGLTGLITRVGNWRMLIGISSVCVFIAVDGYFLLSQKISEDPILAISALLPVALLIAPYSWSYDQLLLAVPLIFILATISLSRGNLAAGIYMGGTLILVVILVMLAYYLGHDIWSLLVSVAVWISVLWFASGFHRKRIIPLR